MEIKTVTQTRYVCENCGATYSDKNAIWQDEYERKDVCRKCAKIIHLIDKTLYDCNDPEDIGTIATYLHPDAIKAEELDLDLDREEYVKKAIEIRKKYFDSMNALDKAYLRGEVRDFQV